MSALLIKEKSAFKYAFIVIKKTKFIVYFNDLRMGEASLLNLQYNASRHLKGRGNRMIKSLLSLNKEPFNRHELALLSQQKQIADIIKMHAQ
ncbi:MAG: hypothetical protein ACJAUP_002879 [Cellvibrionaceae bacterium]|jgi:hypothetical protein